MHPTVSRWSSFARRRNRQQIIRRAAVNCESLENRTLMSIVQTTPVASFVANAANPSANDINLLDHFADDEATGTMVELQTSGGTIDISLTDSTPTTRDNFLHYVNSGL